MPGSHCFTPKSALLDALGRTIRTTEHIDKTNPIPVDNIVMRYRYDIRGNLMEVADPLERIVFKYVYDFRTPKEKEPLPPLFTKHLDQGTSTIFFDVIGKPVESKDQKDAFTLVSYDEMDRPIRGWSRNNISDTVRMTSYAVYGEAAPDREDHNLCGQLWQQYDDSGLLQMDDFDFKGNLLTKRRFVISVATLKASLDIFETFLIDWTGLPAILDSSYFQTDTEFDALNRAMKITLPENVETDRKEIIPTYSRSGGLEKVSYDGTEYVRNIVYNARGQRLLIAFGNDIMTRYVYDHWNFSLKRQRSEKYTFTQVGNEHTYDYDSGTNKQDDGFRFDLVGNILKILHRVTDCGITGSLLGTDKLDRNFGYNPVYRLTSADGRESETQNGNNYLYADAPAPGSPNADNVNAYTRLYSYDKLGNVLQIQQTGANAFTRDFVYNTGFNTLQKIQTADTVPSLIEDYTYDSVGNQITAGSTRNYVWDAANQLITYYNKTGSADPTIFAQYDYSGGERVSKMVRTGTGINPIYERTVYIDGIFEYHIYEGSTTHEKNYVHIMDDSSRIAMVRITDGTIYPDNDITDDISYNLSNEIGSLTIRLKDDGSVIDREEYYPFGDSSLRTFSMKRYRYVGREKDLESGLYYYGARYYAAWTCRFISVDPLAGKYAQLSPYNYADNNPINDYDIDGMQDKTSTGSNQSTPQDATHVNKANMQVDMHIHAHQAEKFAQLSGGKLIKSENANQYGQYTYMVDLAGTDYTKPGVPSNLFFFNPGEDNSHLFKEVEDANASEQRSSMMMLTVSGTTSTGNGYVIAAGIAVAIVVGVYLYYNPPTHTELTLPRYRATTTDRDLPQAISIAVPTTTTFTIPDDLTNVFLHYTDEQSILSIGATSTIRADYKNRVFITPMLLSPKEVVELLFLGREGYKSKGDYVIMFKLRPDQMANIIPDNENIMEFVHRGNIKLVSGQILYIGPNPLK